MHLKHLKVGVGVLLTVFGLAPQGTSQAKRGDSPAVVCPDQRTYTGRYRNIAYGFSIVIPAGLKGYWNSAGCAADEQYGCVCMGDHGRFIPLADGASVEAFVGYEMEEGWSAKDYEDDEIADLRRELGAGQVKVLGSKPVMLGRLRGRRFVVQLREKNRDVLVERIIALHGGVKYELILHTLPERYKRDLRAFEKVRASWRLTPRGD